MGFATGDRQRLLALDGLRAYAAIAVIFYHGILHFDEGLIQRALFKTFWEITATDQWPKLWLSIFNGTAAVELFFLLSGCVLIRSLSDIGNPWRAGASFAVKRVFRIYPGLIACVLAAALLQAWPISWSEACANMALWSYAVIQPSWTLQVEMLAVPLMLLAGVFTLRWGMWGTLAVLVYTCIARKNPELLGVQLLSDYGYLFIFGALVPSGLGAFAAKLARPIGWALLLVAFLLLRQFVHGLELLTAALGFVLLALLYHDDRAASSPVLVSPLPAFLGRVSFGLYLWNVLFLNALHNVPPSWLPSDAVLAGILVSLVIIPPSVFLAAVSYRLIELPGIALGRKLSRAIVKGAPRLEAA
ncbi:acyltransferase [Mesorhizobium sp. B2-8-3]|uniref:acyltransferase family protein n=1 Tax=Mesorhizobium sp. B2-8-3 TaxID=2589905 RepID=UPI001126BB47|nr:acyltransferase [Mesorhizobium sp. B2-8-3]TPJ32019.1 acyltransferase [Mesorhizobium sp. B2-8-3]